MTRSHLGEMQHKKKLIQRVSSFNNILVIGIHCYEVLTIFFSIRMVELQHKCRIKVGSSDLKFKIIMRPNLIISPQDILMKHLVFLLFQLFKDKKMLLPHRFPWGCIER